MIMMRTMMYFTILFKPHKTPTPEGVKSHLHVYYKFY